MSGVEVLAPVRLETRFVPPSARTDGSAEWMLRLRVYPDEFSMRRLPQPGTPQELDRLSELIERMRAPTSLSEADAFASFASAVGAARAFALWRAHVTTAAGGQLAVDRTNSTEHESLRVHGPAGLPSQLDVWFVHEDGTRKRAATLQLDLAAIGADLNLARFTEVDLDAAQLPDVWWLSYPRAVEVGLGIDIDIGTVPPKLAALVVVGVGDVDASELIDAHNATSRMSVLAPGTPTNTVAGEPTTDFGDNAASLYPLLHTDPITQLASIVVIEGLSGRMSAGALPMLGGELDYFGPGSLAVQGFWPVLWGRYLRDVTGARDIELELARWAIRHLAVEGPRPAFRVGEQPYGLLPSSCFSKWVDDPSDPLGAIEHRIRRWALPWRRESAAANRAAAMQTIGQDTRGLLRVFGLHAPSRYWGVRATADLYTLQALRLSAGLTPLDERWDRDLARATREVPAPLHGIGRAPGRGGLPGPPQDEQEDAELLRRLPTMHPEPLLAMGEKLGLIGHLMRESLIAARAIIGEAYLRLSMGNAIELGQPLPLDDELKYVQHVMRGSDDAAAALRASNDANGRTLAARFIEVQEALQVIADLWKPMGSQLFRATLAALDTSAFRVDPWLTGLAERRLQHLIREGAAFRLGAYGWVDAPAPYAGTPNGPLAPGPTAAGLLHAPSQGQALTAALLRDAAIRHPTIDAWKLNLDSAKVRAAIALAERVRLGVHPHEALGLEVEKIAGDWDVVRVLRKQYPLAADQQERRVCDGQKVMQAAREGTLPNTLPPDLATRLAPLDHVLDTYADLLVADGVHMLVNGRADLANAAMEAAAGLGAPPDLRAVRTPRQATTVRVSVWVLLPPQDAPEGADADPAKVADPTWDPSLTSVLGGADDETSAPSLTGGTYEGLPGTADADLRDAIAQDFALRRTKLMALTQGAIDALADLDLNDANAPTVVEAAATRWHVDLTSVLASDPSAEEPSLADRRAALVATLKDRMTRAAEMSAAQARTALRLLAGRTDLPVLPIVPRARLPELRVRDGLDRDWLEIVAAVRPRLAPLEAHQLDPARPHWPAAVAAPNASTDPWRVTGPVVIAYGPGTTSGTDRVALAVLDGWTDSVPSRKHTTAASFGFNAPKSRAPHAVLVAVPPNLDERLDNEGLLDVVLETRELAQARVPPQAATTLPYQMSTALVGAVRPHNFLDGWPA